MVNKQFYIKDSKNIVEQNQFKDFKFFSTREKAEEYVKLNKPLYSILDIKNCVEKYSIHVRQILSEIEILGNQKSKEI